MSEGGREGPTLASQQMQKERPSDGLVPPLSRKNFRVQLFRIIETFHQPVQLNNFPLFQIEKFLRRISREIPLTIAIENFRQSAFFPEISIFRFKLVFALTSLLKSGLVIFMIGK